LDISRNQKSELTLGRRNLGILIAFAIFYLGVYLAAAELVSSKKGKGEVLVFRRGYELDAITAADIESSSDPILIKGAELATSEVRDMTSIEKHTSLFHWRDICFDLTLNKEKKRILDHIDGWIKPGTLTALLVGILFTHPRNHADLSTPRGLLERARQPF